MEPGRQESDHDTIIHDTSRPEPGMIGGGDAGGDDVADGVCDMAIK